VLDSFSEKSEGCDEMNDIRAWKGSILTRPLWKAWDGKMIIAAHTTDPLSIISSASEARLDELFLNEYFATQQIR
jgi:hypothetical protein